jgi:RNA polymerase sigma-70 factor, ECF subfamily
VNFTAAMKPQETYSDFEERELVVAAQRGDRAAFKEIYDRFRDRVYNLAFYSLGESLAAEDVLQIVFMKIHRGLPGFRFESQLSTWIYRIALNQCLNENRRRVAQHVPLESLLGSGDEIDISSLPDDKQVRNERREIIRQAVMELSPKLRSVIALKYLEGLSYTEVAQVLECSPGTVASRLNRALTQMEARLRPLRRLL